MRWSVAIASCRQWSLVRKQASNQEPRYYGSIFVHIFLVGSVKRFIFNSVFRSFKVIRGHWFFSSLCKNTSTSQTDRQTTDGRMTYCGITALCVASRGKNPPRIWVSYGQVKCHVFMAHRVYKLNKRTHIVVVNVTLYDFENIVA